MAHFPADALRFLDDLDKHNNRDWFEKNRDRFEKSLRDPYVQFLVDLAPRLSKVSPRFVVDAKPHGGSLARIHRDMRFTKDDRPYKVALSAHFAHDKAKDGARPSFFLYVGRGTTHVGGGIRQPDPVAMKKLKKAMTTEAARFTRVTKAAPVEHFNRGLIVTVPFTDGQVTSPRFVEDVADACKKVAPFVAFVTEAVGLKM